MTTWPAASTPCTCKTDLAMSRPIVVIVCMDAPPNRGSFNSAHIFGTHVPVEEPSTASEPDSCTAAESCASVVAEASMPKDLCRFRSLRGREAGGLKCEHHARPP